MLSFKGAAIFWSAAAITILSLVIASNIIALLQFAGIKWESNRQYCKIVFQFGSLINPKFACDLCSNFLQPTKSSTSRHPLFRCHNTPITLVSSLRIVFIMNSTILPSGIHSSLQVVGLSGLDPTTVCSVCQCSTSSTVLTRCEERYWMNPQANGNGGIRNIV